MTKTFNDAATVKETSFGGDYDAQTKAVYDVLVKVQNNVVVTREDLSIDIDHNPPFEALNKKAEDYQDWPEVGQFLFQCELSFRDYNQAVKRHHDYNDAGDCNNDRPDVIVH